MCPQSLHSQQSKNLRPIPGINRHNPTRAARPKLANLQSWLATTMALICRNALCASDAIISRPQLVSFRLFSSKLQNSILARESDKQKKTLGIERPRRCVSVDCVFGDESSHRSLGMLSLVNPVARVKIYMARETRPCLHRDAHFRPKVRFVS